MFSPSPKGMCRDGVEQIAKSPAKLIYWPSVAVKGLISAGWLWVLHLACCMG